MASIRDLFKGIGEGLEPGLDRFEKARALRQQGEQAAESSAIQQEQFKSGQDLKTTQFESTQDLDMAKSFVSGPVAEGMLRGQGIDTSKLTKDGKPFFEDESIVPLKLVKEVGDKLGKQNKDKDRRLPDFLLKSELAGGKTVGIVEAVAQLSEQMGQNILSSAKQKFQSFARGFAGGNDDITAYEQQVDTLGRALYKDVSGDVGNISQSEGKFATALLPRVFESPGVRASKIQFLRDIKARGREINLKVEAMFKANKIDAVQAERLVKEEVLGLLHEAVNSQAARLGTAAQPGQEAAPPTEGAPTGGAPADDFLSEFRRQRGGQ